MLAAILICGACAFTSCSIGNADNPEIPVKPEQPKVIDLSALTNAYTVLDGQTITGSLGKAAVQISVAPSASITIQDVSINADDIVHLDDLFSGITCLGDATITLSGDNVIRGFNNFYPAIFVPENHTLTIQGDGSLDVKGSGTINPMCAAIGTGSGPYEEMSICGDIAIGGQAKVDASGAPAIGPYNLAKCGNITIGEDAYVVAKGISYAPGIGCGNSYTWCKVITISGGTVIASCDKWGPGIGTAGTKKTYCEGINITGGSILAIGGEDGPGIGSGPDSTEGIPIVITSGIKTLTAIRGSEKGDYIGAGDLGTRGSVTIDGVENATPENTFPNLQSSVYENNWTLSTGIVIK